MTAPFLRPAVLPLCLLLALPAQADPASGQRLTEQSRRDELARPTVVVGQVPRGYRVAWKDGRLNPQRGPRTLRGQAQMRRVWTDDVPRRLRN